FKAWWAEGFASWRRRNDAGTCVFLCELGPPEYAMTGRDGREMSDRWAEALTIKSWAEEIWAETALAQDA
ncbi:MAG: sugar phosphate isomerase/epimerase, partial [Pseudomonadota bacterium]